MLEQLAHRRELLHAGAEHLGWKLGVGERESIGGSIAVGYLTSATCLEAGDAYRIDGLDTDLRADVELAVELGCDLEADAQVDTARAAIAGYRVALELVNLAPALTDARAVVATNVFHRAVIFGARRRRLGEGSVRATARVNAEERATGELMTDVAGRLLAAARVLGAVGERLRPGDWVITGSIVQIAVGAGDLVEGELGDLGSARVEIAS